jgi:peptide-methionine (S)-S-oxide reductase
MNAKPPAPESLPTLESAVLGGGCFWCLEAVFMEIEGVVSAVPGYAGGHTESPSYQEVCTGSSGHAEVVRLTFDPQVLPFRDVLTVFFHSHDPTTLNEQGPDKGTQYRSIALYQDQEQKEAIVQVRKELEREGLWGKPFVTEVMPLQAFYPAEEHHLEYYLRHPEKKYCQAVISPKIIKLRQHFADRLKSRGKT